MPRRRPTRSISLVAALLFGPVGAVAVAVAPADPLVPPPAPTIETDPGLTVRIYEVDPPIERLRSVAEGQTPNVDVRVPALDLQLAGFQGAAAPWITQVQGWLRIESAGEYAFALTSDDGSDFALGGVTLIDHDGRHGATTRSSVPIDLATGWHPIRVRHFESGGNSVLRLTWRPPGAEAFTVVPESVLACERDLTRVVSPGRKRLAAGRRPGDRVPLADVHPSWRLETIRPDGFEPQVGCLALLPDGRLIVGTFDPLQRDDRSLPDIESKAPDTLFALTGWDSGDREAIGVRAVATDLFEPAGACVLDGELYVSQRRSIVRLLDRDGDGFFETHETVASGWEGWNYHQFTLCLTPGRPGARLLYAALSTTMAPPAWEGMETNAGPNGPMRGSILEIDVDTGSTRVIAGGTRTPNGLGRGPGGELLYADNQGAWFPTSVLSEVLPGRFYGHWNWTRRVPRLADRYPDGGHPSVFADRPVAAPAVFLPHGEASNSPTVPVPITRGPFAGQLLLGELTAGGLRRVMLERVEGQLQGAVVRHSQGFESGVNRIVAAPDGSLIVGGIGAGGNWNWRATRHGLQRLVPTGATTFEFLDMRATPTGFDLSFTEPVDGSWLTDPANYRVRQWWYRPTAAYGGERQDVQPVRVTRATPAADGRSVRLEIPGLRPGWCVGLEADPVSTAGTVIHSPEIWYTLNRIPAAELPRPARLAGRIVAAPDRSGLAGRPHEGLGVGVPAPPQAVPLLGRSGAPLMRYRGEASNRRPPRDQAAMISAAEGVPTGNGSGDLVSDVQFGDARLHLEWYCPPGGAGQLAANSGVYLQDRYELQVLGSPPAPAAPAPGTAGAIYGQHAARVNASTGAGTWQAYDVFFRAARFDGERKTEDARVSVYWNGVLVHDDVALAGPTGSRAEAGESPHPRRRDAGGSGLQLGPLVLQDHASAAEGPVRWRNVWIAPLDPVSGAEPGPWRDLLAGGMDDFTSQGGRAAFEIVEGDAGTLELVGTTRPNTPNTFLATRASWDDFELLLSVRVHPELNSGIQIRSRIDGEPDDRRAPLAGMQVEIDPSDRAWAAGLYEERGRGWLAPLHEAPYARRAFRQGAWNDVRIVARGPVIRTWINGVPATDAFDAVASDGRLGFQVHGVGARADPLEVRFRDIRIRRLGPGD